MSMFLLFLGAVAMVFCAVVYPWHCLAYVCFCGMVLAVTYRRHRPRPLRFETERESKARLAKERKG